MWNDLRGDRCDLLHHPIAWERTSGPAQPHAAGSCPLCPPAPSSRLPRSDEGPPPTLALPHTDSHAHNPRFTGDGTVLHLASLFADDARPIPPVISFAMGTLGFLTPFSAGEAEAVLAKLLWPPWQAEPVFCTLRTRRQCEVYW